MSEPIIIADSTQTASAASQSFVKAQIQSLVSSGQAITAAAPPPAPVTACQITVEACPNYPSVIGSFLDNYLNAGSNAAECEQRASDYESWCGTTQPITANYFLEGALVATKTVGSSGSSGSGGGGGKHPSKE